MAAATWPTDGPQAISECAVRRSRLCDDEPVGAPAVSIVLPVRDAAGTVGASLASIRRQTLISWECLVVDDGSSDTTTTVVRACADGDPRFRLIRRPREGVVAALNAGLSACRAPLVARMDADDVMRRDRLRQQVEALTNDPGLWAVGTHVRLFPRAGLSSRRRDYERWLNSLRSPDDVRRDCFVECPVAHPTLMMRAEMAALGYEDRPWAEDYDLVLRALARGGRIGIVARPLLAWRDGPDRASRRDPRYGLDRFVECKAAYLAQGYLAGSPSYVLWGYGDTGRMLRAALLRYGKTLSHVIEVKASRIGQRIHGAPVLPIADVASLRGQPLVVSVAREGPRQEIRTALAALGFIEGREFVCAA